MRNLFLSLLRTKLPERLTTHGGQIASYILVTRLFILAVFVNRITIHLSESANGIREFAPHLLITVFYFAWIAFTSKALFVGSGALSVGGHSRKPTAFKGPIPLHIYRISIVDSITILVFLTFTFEPATDIFLLLFWPLTFSVLLLNFNQCLTIYSIAALGYFAAQLAIWWLLDSWNPNLARIYAGLDGFWKMFTRIIFHREIFLFGFFASLATVTQLYRSTNELLESILNNLQIVIWRKDASGYFTYVNDEFCAITGLSREQVLKRRDQDVFKTAPKEMIRSFERGDQEVLSSKRELVIPGESFPLPGGLIQLNYVKKVPLLDAEGRAVGTEGFFVKYVADTFSLTDASILSSIAIHAENLNHDLRTDLSQITGFAVSIKALVKESRPRIMVKSSRAEKFADNIQVVVKGLEERLKDLGRIRTDYQRKNLIRIDKAILRQFNRQIAQLKEFSPEKQIESGVKGFVCEEMLCSAIKNMLTNAIAAISESGTSIGAASSPTLRFRFYTEPGLDGRINGHVVLTNSGVISQKVLDAISLGIPISANSKPHRIGHGYGVHIIKEFARVHDGDYVISPDTANGLTTCFLSFVFYDTYRTNENHTSPY